MLELDSDNSDNQVLTVLRLDKETRVTWTYGKKAVDSANNGTETAEEPTKLLTVSMLLAMFKWAIAQCGMSVSKILRTSIQIYLLKIYCGPMCPFSWYLP